MLVVLVVVRPPVVVELFSQHQQRGCFSERLVFAAQFALKFLDAFLVLARLLAIFFLLSLCRFLAGDKSYADKALQQFMALKNYDPQSLTEAARIYRSMGQSAQAISELVQMTVELRNIVQELKA